MKETLEQLTGSNPDLINEAQTILNNLHPNKAEPINNVQWVPINKVRPNDYNPNSVASTEMQLLLRSITADGITQPVVTIYNKTDDMYEIVDGFHRYTVIRTNPELHNKLGGLIPIVTINKPIAQRMASTVRHNRARGKHSIDGMSNLVFNMLNKGMTDAEVCNELGMEPEELLRLKHITGFAKLFTDTEYARAWETKRQIRERFQHKKQQTTQQQEQNPPPR